MKICVFGAGAIGGWLAGNLAGSGIDVSVVARGEHLRAIRSDGLTVETPNSSVTSRPRASDDPAELGVQDAATGAAARAVARSLTEARKGRGARLILPAMMVEA